MPRVTTPEQFISLQAGASAFDVSVFTLRRRIQDGSLPAYRSGRLIRVKVSDLDTMFRPVASARQAG